MSENKDDFNQKLISAIESKTSRFNSVDLPKIQEDYRLHLTCVRNLFEAMISKGLAVPDPYKKDKKISSIVCPENTEFNENERAVVFGMRMSDYETMVDFICNYMKFSVDQLGMDTIRKLIELNATFNWTSITENSNKPNTKALGVILKQLKNNATPIVMSLLKDTTSKSAQVIQEINECLKQLADFQKERYKCDVRKNILLNDQFNSQKAYESIDSMMAEIKKMFPQTMGRKGFVTDLIMEIANEELAPNKEALRQKLMEKMAVQEIGEKKEAEVIDTKEVVMEAARVICSTFDQIELMRQKIVFNHDVLQSEHNSFKDKLTKFFRRMFDLKEPEVEYEIIIIDKKTDAKRREKIKYTELVDGMLKRSRYYASIATKHTPGWTKMFNSPEDDILEFLNRQIIETNKLFTIATSLDEYFKGNVQGVNRQKIKGLKIELTTFKNVMVKANQERAEYLAYREEQDQMKKLGIIKDEKK